MFNYERLSDDIKIAVSSDHTFGTDAVILSDFAKIKPRDKALDMGTGCGIIPLLWLRNFINLSQVTIKGLKPIFKMINFY